MFDILAALSGCVSLTSPSLQILKIIVVLGVASCTTTFSIFAFCIFILVFEVLSFFYAWSIVLKNPFCLCQTAFFATPLDFFGSPIWLIALSTNSTSTKHALRFLLGFAESPANLCASCSVPSFNYWNLRSLTSQQKFTTVCENWELFQMT